MDEKKFDLIISFIFSILQLILWILSLIWLCKVNKNAKDEPANRSLYYNGEEISEFYIIGDFITSTSSHMSMSGRSKIWIFV